MRAEIRAFLEKEGFREKIPRLQALLEQHRAAHQQAQKIGRRISVWDRLNVLTDTPEELREKQLLKISRSQGQEATRLAAQWEAALRHLSGQHPSFGILLELEELVQRLGQALQGKDVAAAVAFLRRLSERLLAHYCGGASLWEVVWPLRDSSQCGMHVVRDIHAQRCPEQGWKPVSGNDLRSICARSLYEDPAYPQIQALTRWPEGIAYLPRLFSHLRLYPPAWLALQLENLAILVETAGLVKEHVLTAQGQLEENIVLTLGGPIIEQLDSILRLASHAFPDTAWGFEARGWFQGRPSPPPIPPPESWPCEAELLKVLTLSWMLRECSQKVSKADRLNVFHESESEKLEKLAREAVQAARAHLSDVCQQRVAADLQIRSRVSQCALTDGCISSVLALSKVSTKEGKSSSKLKCPLHNKEAAVEAVMRARQFMASGLDLPATLEHFAVEAVEGRCLVRIDSGQLAELLRRAREFDERYDLAVADQAAWEGKITALDRLNVFSDSPAEQRARDAKEDAEELARARDRNRSIWRQVCFEALRAHPAASLYYETEELDVRVRSLTAVCRSRTTHNSKGGSSTTYWCEVAGLSEARGLAKSFAERVYRMAGPVLGPHGWLTQQALERAVHPALHAE